jgi:endoglucanase
VGSGPLGASGAKLVDVLGREVRLTGVNWSGLETSAFAPIGLASRSADEMLDQIASAGFNTIRLPYSNQLFDATSRPNGIDFQKNPDLYGLSGIGVMDWIVEGARRRGLKIILDRHRPTPSAQSDLWYTDSVSEDRWIHDWLMLARRYRGSSTVVGADLHNEPHGAASWGDGNPQTDWRLAAERAGNAILEVNPDWLIIVEGVERTAHGAYWWGGNLSSAGEAPVRLTRPERLVYSPHDYGPSVSWQQWFAPPAFPANLESVWQSNWAYLHDEAVAPVLLGEFGGRSVGQDTEGVWQRALIGYIQDRGFSYAYWVWNFDGWTGGLLQDDQVTLNQAKLGLLSPTQWPLFGQPDKASPRRPAEPAPRSPRPD